jgi:hypothetical protein
LIDLQGVDRGPPQIAQTGTPGVELTNRELHSHGFECVEHEDIAGHESGYLLRSSGDIGAVLASTAIPLGIFPDQQFSSGPIVPLEHGDTILLLTDGIKESEDVNGAVFGAESALDFIRCQQQSTAGELVQGLYRAVRTFAGGAPQMDDIMSFICKVEWSSLIHPRSRNDSEKTWSHCERTAHPIATIRGSASLNAMQRFTCRIEGHAAGIRTASSRQLKGNKGNRLAERVRFELMDCQPSPHC